MEISQLRSFLAVAEELHFGRAAERLHIAQPPLTRAIQQLERELGTRLFDRTTRSVRLTSAGQALVGPARDILDGCRSADSAVRAAGRGDTGRVRIGFAGPSSHRLVGKLARRVRRAHPGIELVLTSSTFGQEATNRLLGDVIDLAIVRWSSAPPGISSRVVQTERYVVVVPADHRLAERESVRLSELRNDRFVVLPPGSDVRDHLIEACYTAGFAPDIGQVAPDSWTQMALVAAGVGVSLTVDTAVIQMRPDGLHMLALRDPLPPAYARLAWRSDDTNPALAQVLRASRAVLPTPRGQESGSPETQ